MASSDALASSATKKRIASIAAHRSNNDVSAHVAGKNAQDDASQQSGSALLEWCAAFEGPHVFVNTRPSLNLMLFEGLSERQRRSSLDLNAWQR